MSTIQVIGQAGADLSALQYTAVYSDGSDTENFKSATSQTHAIQGAGVLLNTPVDNADADVIISGITDAIAGGALEPWDRVTNSTGGKFVVATSGDYVWGMVLPVRQNGSFIAEPADGEKFRLLLYANKVAKLA